MKMGIYINNPSFDIIEFELGPVFQRLGSLSYKQITKVRLFPGPPK